MATVESFELVNGVPTITKDPGAEKEYTASFATWLARSSDTIASVSTVAENVTVDNATHDDDTVTVWLSGGTPGAIASVEITIVTAGARTEVRTLYFAIAER